MQVATMPAETTPFAGEKSSGWGSDSYSSDDDGPTPGAAAAAAVRALIQKNIGDRQHRDDTADSPLVAVPVARLTDPFVWEAREDLALPPDPFARDCPTRARRPRRRAVLDELLTEAEVVHFSRDARDQFGDALFADGTGAVAWGPHWAIWDAEPINAQVRLTPRMHGGSDLVV